MDEIKLKKAIQDCKIKDLQDLAKLIEDKNSQKDKVVESFKLLSKNTLEKQCNIWEGMLLEIKNQLNSANALSSNLTEENQNEMIENMFTIKECKFIYYRMLFSTDYYKDCIKLMKKILKTK